MFRPHGALPGCDMDRIENILPNRPYRLGESHDHGRCSTAQRVMRMYPVIQVPPHKQRRKQLLIVMRDVARPSRQAGLLGPHGSVDPFDMARVDAPSQFQTMKCLEDVAAAAEQAASCNPQDVSCGIAHLMDHGSQQTGRRLEIGMFEAAMTAAATARKRVTPKIDRMACG